jgi:hypothetical protein
LNKRGIQWPSKGAQKERQAGVDVRGDALGGIELQAAVTTSTAVGADA